MYELDFPRVIKTAFSISTKSQATENGYEVINIAGFASKMYDANGKFVVDADAEIVNTAKIDLKRLKLGRLPLLYQHDQKLIVGNVLKAEYKPEGLYVEAQVVKFPDDPVSNQVYHGVKSGVLNSFSIGALVKQFDITSQDSEDYLVLDETELIELSIVTVPANPESGFRAMTGFTKGVLLPKTELKAQNPDVCNEFSCAIEKAVKANVKVKGLTLDETLNEGWFKSQEFSLYLDAFTDTIRDNFYANKWDELPAEEAKANMIEAFTAFLSSKLKLDKNVETDSTKGEVVVTTKGSEVENKEMVAGITEEAAEQLDKIAQGEPVKEPEVDHSGEVVVADAAAAPSVDDKPSQAPVDEAAATREDASTDNQGTPTEVPKGTEEPAEATPATEGTQDVTLDSIEEFIGGIDLDTVEADSLEKLLGIADMINIAIETKIKEQLQAALNI